MSSAAAVTDGAGVRVRYPGGGAGTVTADPTDDVAARIFHRLSAIANGLDDPTDNRSLEQRADVFVDLILGRPIRARS